MKGVFMSEINLTPIDSYILNQKKELQNSLFHLRNFIKNLAPDSLELIAYGIPTFKLNGNLVHFGASKNHIGFYPAPSAIIKFKEDLHEYKCTKGTIQFPFDKPIPFDLVKKIVEFRIEENLANKK